MLMGVNVGFSPKVRKSGRRKDKQGCHNRIDGASFLPSINRIILLRKNKHKPMASNTAPFIIRNQIEPLKKYPGARKIYFKKVHGVISIFNNRHEINSDKTARKTNTGFTQYHFLFIDIKSDKANEISILTNGTRPFIKAS